MTHLPSSPDDYTLAPLCDLTKRGVVGDPSVSVKIRERTIQFTGPHVRNAQSNFPIPIHFTSTNTQSVFYFEVTVLEQPRAGASLVCVGLARGDCPGYTLGPGLAGIGVGFHSAGRKYINGTFDAAYGRRFGVGDTVGVGWCVRRNTVFFTLNGEEMGTAAAECLPVAHGVYPTVGGTRDAVLAVNFGNDAFIWQPANDQTYGFFADALPAYSAEAALAPRECGDGGEVPVGDVDLTDLGSVPGWTACEMPPPYVLAAGV
ncbi:hypothetical protein H9P43_005386 [Blastocladiella emersonii ATCC 22665]|nr:hypothetical protein H9P43_005386 [Blastocladiella emersonii ATCC 22665]